MIRLTDFTRWVSGTATGPLPEGFTDVSIDSRHVPPGCLYAALSGTKTDGHNFVEAARAAGAAAALVREDWQPSAGQDLPLIRVADPRAALTAGARAYRHTLKARIVGVTGSAGKTTVKELTAAFLSAGGKTSATRGNLNNDLGLPLTILATPPDADFCVWEMGTNHPGEIAQLTELARPDIGIITSIGTAHIAFFKTQDGIADEKGTLLRSLSGRDAFAVLSRENDRFARLKEMSRAPVLEVSSADPSAPFYGRAIDPEAGVMDVTEANGVRTILDTRLPGQHNLSNVLLAFACARRLGVSAAACARALDGFALPGDRGRTVVRNDVTYVADCYNANPSSVLATLETFARRSTRGRRIAVLGDMLELGDLAAELHRRVGARARALKIDRIVTVGPLANAYIAGDDRCANADEARVRLAALTRPGDLVLLKASRGLALERILQ